MGLLYHLLGANARVKAQLKFILKTIKKDSSALRILLDSSLITTTDNKQTYDIKLIECGSYIQLYKYDNLKIKNNSEYEKVKNIKKVDTDSLLYVKKNDNFKTIELKNIIRSKIQCQRLAKANSESWKTFITLTFAENIKNLNIANEKFNDFVNQIRRVYKDFMYLCVPEFQKRGAIHYHLFTNIDINNTKLITSQENKEKFKHIKYWNHGFTNVQAVDNDAQKVIGYISKYMTKDIDNRLFGRRRYFYSQNLVKPKVSYINVNNIRDLEFLNSKMQNKKIIYTNQYLDSYSNDLITFEEYLS